ncbi:MAG TPA: hypothetical protein VFZ34_19860, partial [Blastocatellia bacterium]|nr:hypothetical protein [Blastocatellia bacterium]
MKYLALLFFFVFLVTSACAQDKAFLGKWDIMGDAPNQNVVYWLEVKQEADGKLSGNFLNRGGSVLPLYSIKIENGELVFVVNKNANSPVHRAKVVGQELKGSVQTNNGTINWTGVRPPNWGNHNANAKHKFGTPVVLFDGKSLDNFTAQMANRPFGWKLVDGVMTNDVHGT